MTLTDGQRRRWRKWLMIGAIPVAVAGTVLSVKFFATELSADATVTAYDHRAYQEAAEQTEPLFWWNFYEQWKAPYDKGTALAMSGQFEDARALLEEALTLHDDPESVEYCINYINIVYVIEKQGDELREAGDREAANELYREALGLIEQAPPGCMEEPAEREPNTKQQLEESVPRIEAKIEEDDGGGDGESEEQNGEEEPEDGDGGDGDEENMSEQEKELQEREREAEEQRQNQDGYDGDEEGDGGGVDKPW
ncbi:tetratricopeptide repeat protein [Agrococcus casei]|uniref:MNN4 protein n=1 Tax=Agrococcus casei LMG 22410 TaxID=1255656 RepID=A0A1R4FWJ3_9MICO|nr:tetratricopeptide repeat protein [Agrococcus casei]SJM60201.1 MNN4 protein [Agrococcus casei LMG 22410]